MKKSKHHQSSQTTKVSCLDVKIFGFECYINVWCALSSLFVKIGTNYMQAKKVITF